MKKENENVILTGSSPSKNIPNGVRSFIGVIIMLST